MCKINTINIHFLDACNYVCKHCFVNKESNKLSLDELKHIVDKISAFYQLEGILDGRINLAGGEPLLSNDIDDIIDYIYSKGINVSLITNGFYLTKEFIDKHKHQLCCIGISVDSLNDRTNIKIGRCQRNNEVIKTSKLIDICKYIKESKIKLKINTCVSKLNYLEDFNSFLEVVSPDRYKVLQMCCDDYDVVNIKNRITNEEMDMFVKKHSKYVTVIESAEEMKASYLIVDSKGNLSCNNSHQSSYSVLDNDISDILGYLHLNEMYFEKRYTDLSRKRLV